MPRKKAPTPEPLKYRVLRDTGEHDGHGWWFDESELCLGTVERNLYTGDYTLEGYYDNKLLVVERKGCVSEFVANLTHKEKWDDFKQELERMEEFRWPYLVLEFPMRALQSFPVGSGIPRSRWKSLRVTSHFLVKRVCEIELRFKTKIVYCDDWACARNYVSSLFKRVTEACPQP